MLDFNILVFPAHNEK